jgi:Fur family ferric uptake transcriptional regulator
MMSLALASSTTSIEKVLHQAGRRVTPQRMLILETIRESGGHLDADEIHRLARQKAPHLSLSTVYRTINVLKEVEVIEKLHLGDGRPHYEIKKGEHHHLICRGCGKVIEFQSPFSDKWGRGWGEKYDFEITRAHLDLRGYCAECRQEMSG